MTGIITGAHIAPGADVLVIDEHGNWIGRLLNVGDRKGAEAVVAVTDPRANPHRYVGQRVIAHWAQLRVAP